MTETIELTGGAASPPVMEEIMAQLALAEASSKASLIGWPMAFPFRQQVPAGLVKLTDDPGACGHRVVVQLAGKLVLYDGTLFLDHQYLFQTLGEIVSGARLQRPRHADLVHAQADFGSDRLIGMGAAVAASSGLLMALLALGGVHHSAAVVIPHTLFMVGVGIVMPQSMAGALAPFPAIAGTSSALLGFVQMSLAAAVGVLVGHYHDGGPASMALAIAAMGLLTLFSFRMLRRSRAATVGAPTA